MGSATLCYCSYPVNVSTYRPLALNGVTEALPPAPRCNQKTCGSSINRALHFSLAIVFKANSYWARDFTTMSSWTPLPQPSVMHRRFSGCSMHLQWTLIFMNMSNTWRYKMFTKLLQCSDGLTNKVSNITRRLMDNMKLLLICILRVLLSQHFCINVCMVLFLFKNVIYVFLLLWLCILTLRFFMTTLTGVFPCFSSVLKQMPG
jgi:hypothetical protein